MEKMIRAKQKGTWEGIIILFVLAVILFYRAGYGMDISDETFYLSMAKRFSQGSLLFRDDWNTSQLYGLILVPFYRIYSCLNGSNEGIVLFTRQIFVLAEFYVGCRWFLVLYRWKHDWKMALLPAIGVMLYVRGNIINFSYYSMAALLFLLAIIEWIYGELTQKRWHWILAGISYAVSVLCMPYEALLLPILIILIWIENRECAGQKIKCFVIGIFVAAIIFLLYFGKWIPWMNLSKYLPLMFKDPEMEHEAVIMQLYDVARYVLTSFMKYTWPVYIMTFFIVCLWKRIPYLNQRRNVVEWILFLEFLLQTVYVRTFFESGTILVLFFYVVQMQILYREYRIPEFEKLFLWTGLLFSVVWVLGSNVGERSLNMGILIADIWGIAFLFYISKQQKSDKKIMCVQRQVAVSVMLFALLLVRMFDVYRDGTVQDLTYRVSEGIFKGICTEEKRGKIYERTVRYIKENTKENEKIVTLGCNPWFYLDANGMCSIYSTWEVPGDELAAEYYEMFPEKIPDNIFILGSAMDEYKSWRFSSHGSGEHKGEKIEVDGVYKKLIQDQKWKKITIEDSILYKRIP